MSIETTLILCKPDAVARGLVGEIVGRIERRGYIVTAMKLTQIDGDKARAHYGEHKDKPFFADLVGFITSGPLVALAVGNWIELLEVLGNPYKDMLFLQ